MGKISELSPIPMRNATDTEMQAGTVNVRRIMTPANIKTAIKALSTTKLQTNDKNDGTTDLEIGSASYTSGTVGQIMVTTSDNKVRWTTDASTLTNLNAGQLTTGTVPIDRLGTGTKTTGTVLHGDNTWSTDASALTNLNADQLTAGVVSKDRLKWLSDTGESNKVLYGDGTWKAITEYQQPVTDVTSYVNNQFTGSNVITTVGTLVNGIIPIKLLKDINTAPTGSFPGASGVWTTSGSELVDLNATELKSGTIDVDRIGSDPVATPGVRDTYHVLYGDNHWKLMPIKYDSTNKWIKIGDILTAPSSSSSIVIGDGAGDNTAGSGNTIIGTGAKSSSTEGKDVIIGASASNATGKGAVIIGADAKSLVTAIVGVLPDEGVVVIGNSASIKNPAATGCVAIGSSAVIDTAAMGIAVGGQIYGTGASLVLGGIAYNSSIAIGVGAGNAVTTQSAISIGAGASVIGKGSYDITVGTDSKINTTGTSTAGSVSIGNKSTISSAAGGAIAIGDTATAIGTAGSVISIGSGSAATSTTTSECSIALGEKTSVVQSGISIGWSASTTGHYGIAIGHDAATTVVGTAYAGISIGYQTKSVINSISIGRIAKSEGTGLGGSIAIGAESSATATGGIAIGMSTTSTSGVSIGMSTTATTGVSIGYNSSAEAGIAIGRDSKSTGNGIVICSGLTTPTSDAVIKLGDSTHTDAYIGGISTELHTGSLTLGNKASNTLTAETLEYIITNLDTIKQLVTTARAPI